MEPMVSTVPLFPSFANGSEKWHVVLILPSYCLWMNDFAIAAEAMLEELAFKLDLCEHEE